MQNFTYWMQNFMEMSLQGYDIALGFFFWPLIFSGIIGYVYLKNQSVTAAAVAILILFSVFGNMLIGVSAFYSLMYIVVSLIMTALVLIFITKVRR